jgi:replication factor A2
MQQQIIRFILAEAKGEEGVHVAAIARHLGGLDAIVIRYDPNRERGQQSLTLCPSESLDKLMDEGVVYTTSDESHFAVSQ